jgi:hypothetical protein
VRGTRCFVSKLDLLWPLSPDSEVATVARQWSGIAKPGGLAVKPRSGERSYSGFQQSLASGAAKYDTETRCCAWLNHAVVDLRRALETPKPTAW